MTHILIFIGDIQLICALGSLFRLSVKLHTVQSLLPVHLPSIPTTLRGEEGWREESGRGGQVCVTSSSPILHAGGFSPESLLGITLPLHPSHLPLYPSIPPSLHRSISPHRHLSIPPPHGPTVLVHRPIPALRHKVTGLEHGG